MIYLTKREVPKKISQNIVARLRAEKQLHENEERLRFVLESTQIGCWDLDLVRNATTRSLLHDQMFGYSKLLPHWSYDTFLAHVHPLDRERVDRSFKNATDGVDTYKVEFRVVWPDQSLHWLLSIGRLTRDAAGQGVRLSGVVLDITARKQPEEALQELSRLIEHTERQSHIAKTVLSSIGDFAYIFDKEGRFVYANQGLLDLLGLRLDEVVGKDFFQLPYPEDLAARLHQQIQQVFETQQNLIAETEYTSPTGAGGYYEYIFRPVFAADGTVDQVVGSTRDITTRKRSEQALSASEARYRTLVDNFPNGAVFLFDRELRYIVAGGTGLAAVGLSPQMVVGKTIWDLFPTDIAARDEPILRAALRGEITRVEIPFGERIFRVHTLPVANDQDMIVGGLIITQDITEEKQAEEARIGRETAEQANRAKSEFLSRMSHELRTPLNAILGFGQMLELDDLAQSQRESVDHILSGGRHLLTLINDVLDITGIESGHIVSSLGQVAVDDLVQEAITMIGPVAAQYHVQVHAVCNQNSHWQVLGDQLRLKQVLLNLLTNAIKYNRKGGLVHVTWEATAHDRLRLDVRDTGNGIPATQLSRLFIPFDRLDAAPTMVEGMGLGLALSKQLIEAMGGSIGVRSVVGSGSTFWIELPLVAPAAALCGNN